MAQQTDAMKGPVVIGILALQGAFVEHETILRRLILPRRLTIVLVRTLEDLERCDALIIPGGESTTIALLAKLSGLLDPLRAFVQHKPVWGTCAGAILLAQAVQGAKRGGQELLGGIGITIARNGWGSQVESFEADLDVAGLRDPGRPFTGIFIRAPVVLSFTSAPADPPIKIVARLPHALLPASLATLKPNGIQPSSLPNGVGASLLPDGTPISSSPNGVEIPSSCNGKTPTPAPDATTYVALRQGRHLLTTFHPELTDDDRFHEYFVRECVFPCTSS